MSDGQYDYFGDPNAPKDIARSDSVVDDLFIETAAIKWFLRRDPEYHIIVGSKGTGKSLLLFKKAVLATKKSGIVIAPTPPQKAYAPGLAFADAERWIPYWPLTDASGAPSLVQWASLWEWALLTTICQAWRRHARRQGDRDMVADLTELLHGADQDNPFTLIADELQTMATDAGRAKGQTMLPDAKPLNRFMLRNVGKLPPPYVFLDNQDDLFFDYPEFWKASGQGCFLAIQQLQENSNHRIHVFVTLRPEIVWELSKMQHFPQWTADIFHVQWQDDELIDVLRQRARYLKTDLLPSPELASEDPLHAFFGRDLFDAGHGDYVIRVPRVGTKMDGEIVTPVRDHLLRHTLRRPREMIILGNAILDARRRAASSSSDPSAVLREAVDKSAANDIAGPYLAEIKHRWPWGAPPDKCLRHFIMKHLNKNVLSHTEVRRIEQLFAKEQAVSFDDVRPFAQLASLGLIGWPVEDAECSELVQHFVLPGEQDVDALPAEIKWFLVHPILYAAPFHVGIVPGNVIGPGLPFQAARQASRPKYYTAVICYGPPDAGFAKRIRGDLQSHGVRCFLHSGAGARVGDTWPTVREELRRRGRMLVVCSAGGLESRDVLHELDEQARQEHSRIIPLSKDREWSGADFQIAFGGRDLKPFLQKRQPVRFEKSARYEEGLHHLLKVLERGRGRSHGRPRPHSRVVKGPNGA